MQEVLRGALAEFEVTNGQTLQAIKKAAFELQGKHTTALLDSKKAHVALQAIQKRCNQLAEGQNFSPTSQT